MGLCSSVLKADRRAILRSLSLSYDDMRVLTFGGGWALNIPPLFFDSHMALCSSKTPLDGPVVALIRGTPI